jgi:hypothetical protein
MQANNQEIFKNVLTAAAFVVAAVIIYKVFQFKNAVEYKQGLQDAKTDGETLTEKSNGKKHKAKKHKGPKVADSTTDRVAPLGAIDTGRAYFNDAVKSVAKDVLPVVKFL